MVEISCQLCNGALSVGSVSSLRSGHLLLKQWLHQLELPAFSLTWSKLTSFIVDVVCLAGINKTTENAKGKSPPDHEVSHRFQALQIQQAFEWLASYLWAFCLMFPPEVFGQRAPNTDIGTGFHDASPRNLKGPHRPRNSGNQQFQCLATNFFVWNAWFFSWATNSCNLWHDGHWGLRKHIHAMSKASLDLTSFRTPQLDRTDHLYLRGKAQHGAGRLLHLCCPSQVSSGFRPATTPGLPQ